MPMIIQEGEEKPFTIVDAFYDGRDGIFGWTLRLFVVVTSSILAGNLDLRHYFSAENRWNRCLSRSLRYTWQNMTPFPAIGNNTTREPHSINQP
jgi:hypothetical protein